MFLICDNNENFAYLIRFHALLIISSVNSVTCSSNLQLNVYDL